MTTVVIDNGSDTTKVGFEGTESPLHTFPSVSKHADISGTTQSTYVGYGAHGKSDTHKLEYPINRGIITNFDSLETIWEYAFKARLNVCPTDHPVLLSDSPLSSHDSREKMTSIMFENFNTPALHISMQALLSLYGCGRTTGIVVECGYGVTHAVPVYEGFHLPHAMTHLHIGGWDITEFLTKLMNNKSLIPSKTPIDKEVIRDMKEKLCCVVSENDIVEISSTCESYKLPDGQVITIGEQRFEAPEVLFRPSRIGMDCGGIHEIICESVEKCDYGPRKNTSMFNNVILCGGSSMFPGILERMQWEVKTLTPSNTNIRILAPDKRRYSAWLGGSILASLSTFEDMLITKQEYDEFGPQIVHRKCSA